MTAATRLDGQTIVVVGAGNGIGKAACALLGEQGAHVACFDRDREAARRTADSLLAQGISANGYEADVTNPTSVSEAVDATLSATGRIHGLINSAGITGPLGVPSHEVELVDFDAVLRVNLRGALVLTRAIVPHMISHGYGRIVHVSSIAGKEGNPGMVAYSASKAGLIGLVKTQGKEYATAGIVVNALAPAVIRTPFLDTQPAETLAYMTSRIPMGRVGESQEAAEILAWMISPACSFSTGFTFDLSGGRATY